MPRKRPPSIDLYYDDFLAGVVNMDPYAVGMYMRNLCFQWAHDFVPKDTQQLLNITGATPENFAKHWPAVREKFEDAGENQLVNVRAQEAMQHKLAVIEARSKAGKKGGRPRKKKAKSKRVSKTKAKHKAKKSKSGSRKLEEGSTEEGSRKKEEGSRKPPKWTAEVDAIWAHYKTRRPRARKLSADVRKMIVGRLIEGFTVQDICEAIDGNYASPYHCGQNERQTEYHNLDLIVRTSADVERFRSYLETAGKPRLTAKNERTRANLESYLERTDGEL